MDERIVFEVDETCKGSYWERKRDVVPGGALMPGDVRAVSLTFEGLLALVQEKGSVRICAPREGRLPRRYRLELRG